MYFTNALWFKDYKIHSFIFNDASFISRKSINLAKLKVEGYTYLMYPGKTQYTILHFNCRKTIICKVYVNVLSIHSVCLKFSFGGLCIFILQICKIKLYFDRNSLQMEGQLVG